MNQNLYYCAIFIFFYPWFNEISMTPLTFFVWQLIKTFLSGTSVNCYFKMISYLRSISFRTLGSLRTYLVVVEWRFSHRSLLSTLYQHLLILTNKFLFCCYHFFITKYTLVLLVWSLHLMLSTCVTRVRFFIPFCKTSFLVVSMSRHYLCKFIKAYERGRVCV